MNTKTDLINKIISKLEIIAEGDNFSFNFLKGSDKDTFKEGYNFAAQEMVTLLELMKKEL